MLVGQRRYLSDRVRSRHESEACVVGEGDTVALRVDRTRQKHPARKRERAIRLVMEQRPAHPSEWAALQAVATKLGMTAETLRKWVRQAERNQGRRPGLTTEERQRLKELERENKELRRANEILKKASAYFAQAELDRRAK